jgi:hypothetical protein
LAEAEKRKAELDELRKERDAIYTVDSANVQQVIEHDRLEAQMIFLIGQYLP